MVVSDQLHVPAALAPEERAPGTHWIGSWVGLRGGLDALSKRTESLFLTEIEPWSCSP